MTFSQTRLARCKTMSTIVSMISKTMEIFQYCTCITIYNNFQNNNEKGHFLMGIFNKNCAFQPIFGSTNWNPGSHRTGKFSNINNYIHEF